MARKHGRSVRAVPTPTPEKVSELLRQTGRRRAGIGDRLFYAAVVLVFTVLSVALSCIAPVLIYDCQRDAEGVVSCTVHRRLYGLIPLPDKRVNGIASADTEATTESEQFWRSPFQTVFKTYYALELKRTDGTGWTSFRSVEPWGMSNEELAGGIKELLSADAPQEFHGWTAEKVPLAVGVVFLVPAILVLLAVGVRMWLLGGARSIE